MIEGPPTAAVAGRDDDAAGAVAAEVMGWGFAAVAVTGFAATGFAASAPVSIGSLILLFENIVSSRSRYKGRVA